MDSPVVAEDPLARVHGKGLPDRPSVLGTDVPGGWRPVRSL